jgi:isopentenyldiphosphate isomerase
MDEPEEVLDLVNDQDEIVGTILREEIPDLPPDTHVFVRAANVFIMNSEDRLWIPRRQPAKKIAPNGLDYSAGEHVQAGETYTAAILRGIQEELGLEVQESDLEYIGKLAPVPSVPYFAAIFVYRSNVEPRYNTEDFSSFEWLSPETVEKRIADGEVAKKDLPRALELLVTYNNEQRT